MDIYLDMVEIWKRFENDRSVLCSVKRGVFHDKSHRIASSEESAIEETAAPIFVLHFRLDSNIRAER